MRRAIRLVLLTLLVVGILGYGLRAKPGPNVKLFDEIALYNVSGSVAEIVAATPDGMTLLYTDSAGPEDDGNEDTGEIGAVDISDPADPTERDTMETPGSPTSVAVTPNGLWSLVTVQGTPNVLLVVDLGDLDSLSIERSIALTGAPDHVDVSPDGRYAVITIENERQPGGDGDMPNLPAGFLTIVDLVGAPAAWTTRDVQLTGLPGMRFPTDPEPEYADINANNIAAVTLQENNQIALVNLVTGAVVNSWSAGVTDDQPADLTNSSPDEADFSETLDEAFREPDGIKWTPGGRLLLANEGDYSNDPGPAGFTGGRSFTLFSAAGKLLLDSGATLEMAAAEEGYYNDGRSDDSGCEFEGVEVSKFGKNTFGFVGSERCDFIGVLKMSRKEDRPKLVQLLRLEEGSRPEGLLAIPGRLLFVVANEDTGTIVIYRGVKKALDEEDPV